MIPKFTKEGLLPPGVHYASFEEVKNRYGSNTYRIMLLKGLKLAIDSLRFAGCRQIFLDGSFISNIDLPGDFDACWDLHGVDPNIIDPVLLDFSNNRASQKAKYGGELFPSNFQANKTGRTFLEFFQIDKNLSILKGIICIKLN